MRLVSVATVVLVLAVACKKDAPEGSVGANEAAPAKAKPVAAQADAAIADDERLGRLAIAAIKSGELGPLLAIPSGMSAELRDEISRTQELTARDFPMLLRAMDEAGIERSSIEFARMGDSGLSNGPLGSADVYFRSGDGTEYRVLLNWSRSKSGPAVLGLSRWFKKAGE